MRRASDTLRRLVAATGICVALLDGAVVFAQTRYDPRLRFHALTAGRFTIYFHQREEELARRLAHIAQEVAAEADARLGAPRGRVHVILVDQSDQANGWATVIPYNAIEITAAPPPSHSVIGNSNDWLRLVFAHEYTHVVHLEKSGGWLGSLRHVFGRLPLFYANLALPDWQIEGLAARQESALTGQGRILAGDFRMMIDRAAAAGRFAPLDRATGAVIDWPSGNSPYLYGGFFHEYLARRYGPESLKRLVDETAARLPLLGSRAYRDVYGRSLGQLWKDFETDVRGPSGQDQPYAGDARSRLTHHGFTVASPTFTRDGRLFYSIANPNGFPALMELPASAHPRRVASRFRGNRLAAAGDELVFDQLEFVAQIDVQSDLYAIPLHGGETRRLTRHARAADPDVAPDGKTIVCTVQETGRRILATLQVPGPGALAPPVALVSEPSTEFTAPRWSPDGRLIAAERRHLGGPSEIVIIDPDTRVARAVVSSTKARNTLPSWLPDGTIVFSSDMDGPFTLYRVDTLTGTITRLADAGDGAQAAAMSPDGSRLVFVGYSADGYDLYSVDKPVWVPAAPPARPSSGTAPGLPSPIGTAEPRPYNPWPTLPPRFWIPVVQSEGDDVVVGAATGGSDVLGRHLYAATAGWALDRNRPDVQIDYAYARWWPTIFASIATDTDDSRAGELRSREFTAGAVFPVRRIRWTSTALAAFFASSDEFDCAGCVAPRDFHVQRSALRGGWRLSSAKSYGYSISAEEGTSIVLSSELTRAILGADGDAGAITADVRHYFRVFPRRGVVAARIAAASAWGDERLRRSFSAGGAGPKAGAFDVELSAIGLLRGFDESDVVGDRAAVVNVDYRFPLAWVQRGIGTWPVFLRAVHGAVFADAGHAWDRRFRSSDVRRSVGGELSVDAVFGPVGLTITGGAAWRHEHSAGRDIVAFGRIGRAF